MPEPDCCTVFMPPKAVIKGRLDVCEESEALLDVAARVEGGGDLTRAPEALHGVAPRLIAGLALAGCSTCPSISAMSWAPRAWVSSST